MLLTDLNFRELDNFIDLSTFNCNDNDLNEFLQADAINYQKELISKTYLFTSPDKIISFFSVSNDVLIDKGYTNNVWNRLHRKSGIPNTKRIKQYPSVKIGRLGVDSDYQGSGLGSQMIDFIKGWIRNHSKTASRFLIVDAYNRTDVIKFYEKNDFTLLLVDDEKDKTRIMYFDLIRL